jgi:hypothetical protein
MSDYRARLIEAVQHSQTQQEAREMTDEQLNDIICTSLGLPAGTQFTDEQLGMIADYPKGQL